MRDGPLNPGLTDAAPSMEALPDPDVEEAALTRHFRDGMELAAESFDVPAPAPPPSREGVNLTTWSEGPLRAWIQRKSQAVEAARREFDRAADENHRQRVMGGAIVGLMYESMARALMAIPVPDDLADEPEIEDMFRNVLRAQARPFLEHARRAYHACFLNGRRPRSLRHWSRFCDGRETNLPPPDAQTRALQRRGRGGNGPRPSGRPTGPNGETSVEVIRE